MIPLCLEEGIGLIPWSPLARGFLAGNRKRGAEAPTPRAKSDQFAHDMYYADADFDVAERVVEIASKRGVPPAQIALAWLLAKPGVSAPIIGASKLTHLDDAIAATDLELTHEEMTSLEQPYRPHVVLGH